MGGRLLRAVIAWLVAWTRWLIETLELFLPRAYCTLEGCLGKGRQKARARLALPKRSCLYSEVK